MALPVVTPENYYSPEMNMAYMGSTQFKAFERCEAAALAELKGEYRPPSSAALLVGGYIDAWFSGELPLYQAQHPEIFKRDGTLKAEYVKATEVVARLQADDLYSLLMSGKKQVIRTGTIAGVPFKIKIDSLLDADTCAKIVAEFPNAAAALGLCDGAIVDQKAMASMESVWSAEDHCKVPFVEYYGYDIQGAIYQHIEGHMLPFVLAVGTKETEPDLAAMYIDDTDLAAALAVVEDNAPRYEAKVEVNDDYSFSLSFWGEKNQLATIDVAELKTVVEQIKPAHLRFVISGITWADLESVNMTWKYFEDNPTTWAQLESMFCIHAKE